MTRRVMGTALVVALGVAGLQIWDMGSPALAVDGTVAATMAASAPGLAGEGSPYSYVGNKKCKMCHIKLYKSWAETRMAKSFAILEPGHSKEAKEKYHVDVNRDFTQDAECLECHTVGFQQPGGYAVPAADDKKAQRRAKKLQGVGCESCHGPGSEYVKVFTEIFKSKRKYRVEELYAVGLKKIDKDTCIRCHNDRSPTVNPGDPFDFEKRKTEGIHEHLPLKQRE